MEDNKDHVFVFTVYDKEGGIMEMTAFKDSDDAQKALKQTIDEYAEDGVPVSASVRFVWLK